MANLYFPSFCVLGLSGPLQLTNRLSSNDNCSKEQGWPQRSPRTSLVRLEQAACKNNIHVIYRHTTLTLNELLKLFPTEGRHITSWKFPIVFRRREIRSQQIREGGGGRDFIKEFVDSPTGSSPFCSQQKALAAFCHTLSSVATVR